MESTLLILASLFLGLAMGDLHIVINAALGRHSEEVTTYPYLTALLWAGFLFFLMLYIKVAL